MRLRCAPTLSPYTTLFRSPSGLRTECTTARPGGQGVFLGGAAGSHAPVRGLGEEVAAHRQASVEGVTEELLAGQHPGQRHLLEGHAREAALGSVRDGAARV